MHASRRTPLVVAKHTPVLDVRNDNDDGDAFLVANPCRVENSRTQRCIDDHLVAMVMGIRNAIIRIKQLT